MTQIDFYTHVEDKLRTACRLAAKAYSADLRVMVSCTDADIAGRFDRMLWTAPAISFIPHCMASDRLAPETPIVIDYLGTEPAHDQVLLNLKTEWPPLFSRFRRLIEIVSTEDEDRRLARERFKFYRDRGYEIRTHDLSKAGQP
ncbi:MAG TPA: DNA polymerase III subunit chi, partial [Burkholderiales bacterium]|nr:DNA polymerase III subunit chi [Burkholderiales bacterium]